MTPNLRSWSLRAVSLFGLLTLVAMAAACARPSSVSGGAEAVGTTGAALSTDDAVARAEEWVTAELQYCQSPYGASDPDPSCSPVCDREENPEWDAYRSDCSGIVSYAWGLPAPGRTTSEFAPEQTDITYAIDATELQPGDAINIPGTHMMLFKQWVVPCQTATFIDEAGCSAAITYAHEMQADVTLNGSSITLTSTGETFTAIRYGALTVGSPAMGCGGTEDAGYQGSDDAGYQGSDATGYQGSNDASAGDASYVECYSDSDCDVGEACVNGSCVSQGTVPPVTEDAGLPPSQGTNPPAGEGDAAANGGGTPSSNGNGGGMPSSNGNGGGNPSSNGNGGGNPSSNSGGDEADGGPDAAGVAVLAGSGTAVDGGPGSTRGASGGGSATSLSPGDAPVVHGSSHLGG
jgi:hypothetical protein